VALAEAARPLGYGAEEVIVQQGEAGCSMFIVVAGEAMVTLEPSHQEVARLRPGGFFGEMSLLTGEARTATVTAVTDCDLVEITADAFRQFVLQNPAALEQVGAAVAGRSARLADLRLASGTPVSGPEAPSTFLASVRRFLGVSPVS
jgi:CRP-like cAMP-binding protein